MATTPNGRTEGGAVDASSPSSPPQAPSPLAASRSSPTNENCVVGIPFRNVTVRYSDSKDTTAMYDLADLFIIPDVDNAGGSLVAPHRQFQFINTTNANPPISADEKGILKVAYKTGNDHQEVKKEKKKESEKEVPGDFDLDTIEDLYADIAIQDVAAERQNVRNGHLKRSKVLADASLREMLFKGHGMLSRYQLSYRSYGHSCDACGKSYTDAEAESNGNSCQSCVCCPDCGNVLEPTMDAASRNAWVVCRNCLWRSAVQKDIADLNAHLSDLRLWGGPHETIMRRAAVVTRRANREHEREVSVSNAAIAERDRALGLGLGGTLTLDGGVSVPLMTTAGVLGNAQTTTNSGRAASPHPSHPSGSPLNPSRRESSAASPSLAADAATATGDRDEDDGQPSVITENRKFFARSQRAMQFDSSLKAMTKELLTKHTTNYNPHNAQTLFSSQKVCDEKDLEAARLANQLWYMSSANRNAKIEASYAARIGGSSTTRHDNDNTLGSNDVPSCGADAILSVSDFLGGGAAVANTDDDWFEGPREAPTWSETLTKIRGAAPDNITRSNAAAHAILSAKAMLSASNRLYGEASNSSNFVVSIAGPTLSRVLHQGDHVGSSRWIRHQPLAPRASITHPLFQRDVYTPTSDKILDSTSLSSFLSSKRNPALAGNTCAGRLLPWVRVATTKFTKEFLHPNPNSSSSDANNNSDLDIDLDIDDADIVHDVPKKRHEEDNELAIIINRRKHRMYCYLWNFADTDIKVTSINVVGTNGVRKNVSVVCSLELAETQQRLRDSINKQKKAALLMSGVAKNKTTTSVTSPLDEDEEEYRKKREETEAKDPSLIRRQDTSEPFADSDLDIDAEEGSERKKKEDEEESDAKTSAPNASLDATVVYDGSAQQSPEKNATSQQQQPELKKRATVAEDTEEDAQKSNAGVVSNLSPTKLNSSAAAGDGSALALSSTGGGAPAATTTVADKPLSTLTLFLDSRDRDLESCLQQSTVVGDSIAKKLEESHYIAEGSRILFYIDFVPNDIDTDPEEEEVRQIHKSSSSPFSSCASPFVDPFSTKMVALQISAVATLGSGSGVGGSNASKIPIVYNSYVTFE